MHPHLRHSHFALLEIDRILPFRAAQLPHKNVIYNNFSAIRFATALIMPIRANRVPVSIVYATETGKAERYAKSLFDMFKHGFNVRVLSAEQYHGEQLDHETVLIVIASTFGNGNPPDSGKSLDAYLQKSSESLSELKFVFFHSLLLRKRMILLKSLFTLDESTPPKHIFQRVWSRKSIHETLLIWYYFWNFHHKSTVQWSVENKPNSRVRQPSLHHEFVQEKIYAVMCTGKRNLAIRWLSSSIFSAGFWIDKVYCWKHCFSSEKIVDSPCLDWARVFTRTFAISPAKSTAAYVGWMRRLFCPCKLATKSTDRISRSKNGQVKSSMQPARNSRWPRTSRRPRMPWPEVIVVGPRDRCECPSLTTRGSTFKPVKFSKIYKMNYIFGITFSFARKTFFIWFHSFDFVHFN